MSRRGPSASVETSLRRARWALLGRVTRGLEPLMVVLSAVWIALLVVDLAGGGLPPVLDLMVWAIWVIFGLDFVAKILIAPDRIRFVRRNWLTVLSLVLPAFRILRVAAAFRFLRAARVVRSVGLLRVVTSLNRGLGALGRTAKRRGIGYMLGATALILLVGAAAMSYFEAPVITSGADSPFSDYGDALWWTANTMTTGPIAQPQTPEGRLFGWLLSVYGLGAFGYLTAILASHFVASDRDESPGGGAARPSDGPDAEGARPRETAREASG